jgi:hypothetical protein
VRVALSDTRKKRLMHLPGGGRTKGKTRPTRPGLEGEPYESESNSVYVLGLVRAPLDLLRIREGGRSLNPRISPSSLTQDWRKKI